MNPDSVASQLTKLTGTGQSFSADPGHDTSGRSLTGQDIAASISYANLDRLQYLTAVYVYAHDYSVEAELHKLLHEEAKRISRSGRWVIDLVMYDAMVGLAIGEALHPRRCLTCHGTKYLQMSVAGALIRCEDCNATGNLMVTNADRAKALSVTEDNFKRRWNKKYSQLRERFASIPMAALDKIGKKL